MFFVMTEKEQGDVLQHHRFYYCNITVINTSRYRVTRKYYGFP